MKNNREGFVRIKIRQWIIACRAVILLAPFVLVLTGGFRQDEFKVLMYIVLPDSCLYFALFFRFIVKNPYQHEGEELKAAYIRWSYYLLVYLNMAEIALILSRSFFSVPPSDWFFGFVAVIEAFLAGYAGFYLSGLFGDE